MIFVAIIWYLENCHRIYALMLVGSKLNICCSLFNSFLYNILLSAQNNMADIHSKKTPTTARPKDQERKLWSWSGIQSLSSPLMPKMITAIVENNAESQELHYRRPIRIWIQLCTRLVLRWRMLWREDNEIVISFRKWLKCFHFNGYGLWKINVLMLSYMASKCVWYYGTRNWISNGTPSSIWRVRSHKGRGNS